MDDVLRNILNNSEIGEDELVDDGNMLFTLEDVTGAKPGLAKFIRAILFLERVTENTFRNALKDYNERGKKPLTLNNAKRALFNPNITIRTISNCFRAILKWEVVVMFKVTNSKGQTTLYDPEETMEKIYHLDRNVTPNNGSVEHYEDGSDQGSAYEELV
jgi:hypothetical protein